ncbi:MAG TPA: putative toxin-antitoxin system toxin component, PIN family [Phycisphaerae bacterium]|nr:putative toxin-antitoxin system toxin component, PIN family [Phycisphaerae bacterium]
MDTNILLRGLLNSGSSSGRILDACERRSLVPLLSRPVLLEYRTILTNPELVKRYPILKRRRTKVLLERLAYLSDVVRTVRERFPFPRDPEDAKLLELSIAGNATHLITTDNDLLDLRHGRSETAKRLRRKLPSLAIVTPIEFVEKERLV